MGSYNLGIGQMKKLGIYLCTCHGLLLFLYQDLVQTDVSYVFGFEIISNCHISCIYLTNVNPISLLPIK